MLTRPSSTSGSRGGDHETLTFVPRRAKRSMAEGQSLSKYAICTVSDTVVRQLLAFLQSVSTATRETKRVSPPWGGALKVKSTLLRTPEGDFISEILSACTPPSSKSTACGAA